MKIRIAHLLLLACCSACAPKPPLPTGRFYPDAVKFTDTSITQSKLDVDTRLRGAWVFGNFNPWESNKVHVAFIEDLRKTGVYECLLFSDPARTRDLLGRLNPQHESATQNQRVYSFVTVRRMYLYREENTSAFQNNGFEIVQFQKDGSFITYLIFRSAWEVLIKQHGLAGVIPKDDESPILITATMDEVVKALDQIPNSYLMAKEKWKRLSDLDNLPTFTPEDRQADLDRRNSHDTNQPLPGEQPGPP